MYEYHDFHTQPLHSYNLLQFFHDHLKGICVSMLHPGFNKTDMTAKYVLYMLYHGKGSAYMGRDIHTNLIGVGMSSHIFSYALMSHRCVFCYVVFPWPPTLIPDPLVRSTFTARS